MEYQKKSFKVPLSSEKYRENWNNVFAKKGAKAGAGLPPGPIKRKVNRSARGR